MDRVNGQKHECCQSNPNELKKIKIGSTFFKKVEKPSSVDWKHVSYWEKVVCPESVLLVTYQKQMSQENADAKEKESKNVTDNDVLREYLSMAKQLFHVSGYLLKSL